MKYLTRSHSKEACICSCLSEMGSLIPQIGIKWFRLPFMNRKFRKIQILKPSKLCNCTAHLHSGSFKPSALQHACFPALQNTVKNCNITKDFEHIMKYFFLSSNRLMYRHILFFWLIHFAKPCLQWSAEYTLKTSSVLPNRLSWRNLRWNKHWYKN